MMSAKRFGIAIVTGLAVIALATSTRQGVAQQNSVQQIPVQKGKGKGADKLHGTWVAKLNDLSIRLTFGPKNTVKMHVGTDVGMGTYAVDLSKKPGHLDIDWGAKGKVQTIIEIKGGALRMENNSPGDKRPGSFTKQAITLKKAKTKN